MILLYYRNLKLNLNKSKSFYKIKKDIAKLADVLGHSSIDTTRIYIKTTGKEHKRQLNKMKMILGNNLKEGWNEI
mgnify:CR=1 FL=1